MSQPHQTLKVVDVAFYLYSQGCLPTQLWPAVQGFILIIHYRKKIPRLQQIVQQIKICVSKTASISSDVWLVATGSSWFSWKHYDDVIMTTIASQTTSITVVYSIFYSGVDQRKHQSSASLAFVRGIHRGPVNSPHKRPVTRKMFPFDDVIMKRHNCWFTVKFVSERNMSCT